MQLPSHQISDFLSTTFHSRSMKLRIHEHCSTVNQEHTHLGLRKKIPSIVICLQLVFSSKSGKRPHPFCLPVIELIKRPRTSLYTHRRLNNRHYQRFLDFVELVETF